MALFVHGYSGTNRTPTYRSWEAMKRRCLNPNDKDWQHYGGRGITVCDRWMSYENFLQDMNERPDNTSLDRIDNDLLIDSYSPSNCRWANRTEQRANRRDTKAKAARVRRRGTKLVGRHIVS